MRNRSCAFLAAAHRRLGLILSGCVVYESRSTAVGTAAATHVVGTAGDVAGRCRSAASPSASGSDSDKKISAY